MTSFYGFKTVYQLLLALFACGCGVTALQANALTPSADGAQPVAPVSASDFKFIFGIARMADIRQSSLYVKELQNVVMEKGKELEKKYISFRQSLDAKVKKIQALVKSGVNAEKIKEKQMALQKETSIEERKFQQQQMDIQNFHQNHTMEILRQLRLIFKTVGEKRNLSIVFDSDSALYVNLNQAVDVTAEVLAQLNASYDKKVFAKDQSSTSLQSVDKKNKNTENSK